MARTKGRPRPPAIGGMAGRVLKTPVAGSGNTPAHVPKKPEEEKPVRGHLTCRICTTSMPVRDFPTPEQKTWVPYESLELPPPCQPHLGRKSKSGAVCKGCITNYLSSALQMNPGRAPSLGCLEPGCPHAAWNSHFLTLYLAGTPQLEIYNEAMFKANVLNSRDFHWCIKPGCGAGGLVNPTSPGYPHIECGECKTRFCTVCRIEWHTDMTCQEYRQKNGDVDQNELATLQALAKEGYKRCPRCQWAIKKLDGCNSVYCSHCGNGFNYGTLESVKSVPQRESLPRKVKKVVEKPKVSLTYGMWENLIPADLKTMTCEADQDLEKAKDKDNNTAKAST